MDAATAIRHARRTAGLSQAELARRAGTSQSAVSTAENGRADVTVDKALRLIEAAGWTFRLEPLSSVDAADREIMVLNLQKTPAARLASFFNLLAIRGLARR